MIDVYFNVTQTTTDLDRLAELLVIYCIWAAWKTATALSGYFLNPFQPHNNFHCFPCRA